MIAPQPSHSIGGVAVIGAGNVGAAVVNALVLLHAADRVILYDRNLARAEGEAWDIADGTPLLHNIDVTATDDWQDLQRVRVVVVTVGFRFVPDSHGSTNTTTS